MTFLHPSPSAHAQTNIDARQVLWALFMAILVVAALFAWEGRTGLNLWDEGYLWYGVQRVLLGEVPLRDFQSYDPGRYYWSAALMGLTGARGVVAVRLTIAVMQVAALASVLAALSAVVRNKARVATLVLSALALVVWMAPRHKVFDISISIGLVCVLASWINRPVPARALLAGVYVGLVAWFGRNHGVYGLIASIAVFAYLALRCADARGWWRSLLGFSVGVLAGYSPMLAMMALDRGFTHALVESVRFIFEVKSTNLPLPVPWPWHARFGLVPLQFAVADLVVGLTFVGLLVFAAWATCFAFYRRWQGRSSTPLFVAAAVSSVPYAHYAFSRADVGHLAQGIFPMLVGLLVIFSAWRGVKQIAAVSALLVLSLLAVAPLHPGWQCRVYACEALDVDGDHLVVEPPAAHDVRLLWRLHADFARDGKAFYATPLLPGAYALLHGRSPTWENYTAWPRSDAFQREEIDRLAAADPAFVVVYDLALDGRDELRFSNTHPLMDAYIKGHFIPVAGYTENPAYHVYRAQSATP